MRIRCLLTSLVLISCATTERTLTQQLCESNGGTSCCPGSPIIVDMAGDGIRLTSAEDGVVYMLRRGRYGLWAWTERGSDDAFLALDIDGDGRIGDGSELFGDGAVQIASSAPNGFRALAYYDMPDQGGNGDGVLDARDAVWPRLRLWRDADHDAYSAPSELTALDVAGVHSFSLAATASAGFDAYGNETRFVSTVVADNPISMVVSDVWLTQAPLPSEDQPGGRVERDYTEWTCWGWAYAVQANGPDGPGGANESPCDAIAVQGDPYATTSGGQLARLVARFSTSTIKSTAMGRAHEIVFNAANSSLPGCHTHGFPTPDLYRTAPYDDDGSQWTFAIRVKCTSQVIHTGGGGGGC